MVMTEKFDKLKALQDILAEKYEVESLIQDSPKQLSTQDELLARMKKEFIMINEEYETSRQTVLELKTKLAEADTARERAEKGMDSISTHREYEALDKEIRDASETEQLVRKDLQKEEKTLAELNEKIKQNEQLIASQEKEIEDGKKSLQHEIDSYASKLEQLKMEEDKVKEGIDAETIFKFERIVKSKQGKGIVAVKGNVCDGCHMILPAQFANEVHNGEKIVYCPYCSRILFYQELESGEDEYFHIDDAGSLSDIDDEYDEIDENDEDEDEESDHEDVKDSGFDD